MKKTFRKNQKLFYKAVRHEKKFLRTLERKMERYQYKKKLMETWQHFEETMKELILKMEILIQRTTIHILQQKN